MWSWSVTNHPNIVVRYIHRYMNNVGYATKGGWPPFVIMYTICICFHVSPPPPPPHTPRPPPRPTCWHCAPPFCHVSFIFFSPLWIWPRVSTILSPDRTLAETMNSVGLCYGKFFFLENENESIVCLCIPTERVLSFYFKLRILKNPGSYHLSIYNYLENKWAS